MNREASPAFENSNSVLGRGRGPHVVMEGMGHGRVARLRDGEPRAHTLVMRLSYKDIFFSFLFFSFLFSLYLSLSLSLSLSLFFI